MSQVSGCRSQVSGVRFQVSGLRCQVSGPNLKSEDAGFNYQVSGVRLQVSCTRYQVSGSRYQLSGTRYHRTRCGRESSICMKVLPKPSKLSLGSKEWFRFRPGNHVHAVQHAGEECLSGPWPPSFEHVAFVRHISQIMN